MNLNSDITRTVEAWIEQTGTSQRKLAKKMCFQQSKFNRRMRGLTPWTLRDVERLRAAGVPISLDGVKC